jgi:vacuolar-type H+-ATPase catalytic subunit A/Vma1
LQQNSFTKYDRYCPFYKSVEMMRNIAIFHRLATAAVERTAGGNAEVRLQVAQTPGSTVGSVTHPLC